jgi:hypothetical protein
VVRRLLIAAHGRLQESASGNKYIDGKARFVERDFMFVLLDML